jgi:hypothetical protein
MERERKAIIIDRQALLIQLGSSYYLKSTDLAYYPR